MLHICRVYQPDKVYLYLSKEMVENEEKDQRYTKTIELLGDKLNHHFEVELIKRADFVNVQQYDIYYEEFRNIIIDIEKSMDKANDTLLLNMASGTPAMKSALMILSTLAEYRYQPIQVDSPKKASNSEYEERTDYDVELNWECDSDNEDGYENRCREVKCMNLVRLLKMDILKKHLEAYDYHAALEIGKEIQNEISEEAWELLQVADDRVKLNHKDISKRAVSRKYKIYPVEDSGRRKLVEYALYLQMKVKKEEYADFIRGITPLVVDLLEIILKNKCKFSIDDCCITIKGVRKWNHQKLQQHGVLDYMNQSYAGNFKEGPIYSTHLDKIIQLKSDDIVLKQKAAQLVKIEGKVRNMAAHEVVSVTDEWFRKNCGHSAKDIMELVKWLVVAAGMNVTKEVWNSYDQMNNWIEEALQIE